MRTPEQETWALRSIKHCLPLDDASAERDKELKHLKEMEHEANLAEGWRVLHELEDKMRLNLPQRPGWMRAMGPDDYIEPRTRKVKQERESFEEQKERIRNMKP